MTIDLEPKDGHLVFRVGPIEKRVAMACASLLVAALGYIFWSVLDKMDRQGDRLEQYHTTLQQVVTQQAVANGQIATLSQQLADVPGLSRQIAEMNVQVRRNTEDIKELRQISGGGR